MRNLNFLFSEEQPNFSYELFHTVEVATSAVAERDFCIMSKRSQTSAIKLTKQYAFRIFAILDGKRVTNLLKKIEV